MSISAARRTQYLHQLGVTVWRARSALPVVTTVIEPPPPAAISGEVAATWAALQAEVAACRACTLHQQRTQTVFGVGNQQAQWLVIGEAPGAEEDLQGEPFVGRAGLLLNEMLFAIAHPRETVYIANTVKCRPPNNREPYPEEAAACAHFLRRQIALLNPRIILCVGRVAANNVLGVKPNMAAFRRRVHRYVDTNIPVVVTYHPAYLLRTPTDKAKAWEDLRFAVETLEAEKRNA